MNDLSDRGPPGSQADGEKAEQIVLASALVDSATADAMIESVNEADFYWQRHQVIFAAIASLRSRSLRPTPEAVFVELKQNGTLEDCGGAVYLAELHDMAGVGAEGGHYSRIVRNNAMLRAMLYTLTESMRDVYDQSGSAADLLAELEQKLFDLGGGRRTADIHHLAETVKRIVGDLDKPRDADDSPIIRSGFESLDNLIGGFRAGRLYIVAARPGVGKSALALAFALNAAAAGRSSLMFSLEMGVEEVAERAIAISTGVELNVLTMPPLTDTVAIQRIAESRSPHGVYVDDRAELSVAKMASTTRRAVRAKKVKMAILDYLQLLTPENPRDARYLQVGADTRRLKQLARQCNVPVVCLCQLNRESEGRADRKPMLSDLRDSGEIEQNADAVFLLHRENPQDTGPEQAICCQVAKQRNGPTGELSLTYTRRCVRFENRRNYA